MKNVEALITDGGEITLGALPLLEYAATAADGHNCLAMLVRREGESPQRRAEAAGQINDGRSTLF